MNNPLEIPKKFKLMGQTITVTYPAEKFMEKDGFEGFASYRSNEIQLKPDSDVYPINQDRMGHNFCHELMHFIIYFSEVALKKEDEYAHQNEGFIDLCGGLLHQALTTMEFNDLPEGDGE